MANKRVTLRQVNTDYQVVAITAEPITWERLKLPLQALFTKSMAGTLPAELVAPDDVWTFNVTATVEDLDHE